MAGVDDIDQSQKQSLVASIKNLMGDFILSKDCQESQKENHGKEMKESAGDDSDNDEEKEVCKFFLEGKCRFGDTCFNRHPEDLTPVLEVKNDPKQKASTEEESQVRALMLLSAVTPLSIIIYKKCHFFLVCAYVTLSRTITSSQ